MSKDFIKADRDDAKEITKYMIDKKIEYKKYFMDDLVKESMIKQEKYSKLIDDKIKVDDKANPDICMVYYYHQLIGNENLKTVCSECKAGKRGWVACKKELVTKMLEFLKPIAEKRKYYEERPELVDEILMEGNKRARQTAKETMKKVKKAMKLDYFE